MPERPTISVCVATYNGARFVGEQLGSILSQLGREDEVIVVDDASTDDTVAIISAMEDPRVRILQNMCNQGVISTFERALNESHGDIIFLSDQDDRWMESKVERILREFRDSSVTLVMSAAYLMGPSGTTEPDQLHRRLENAPGFIGTLIKNEYQGSLIALRRSILASILPFPKNIAMHDWWIGLMNAIVGRAVIIREPLVFYRRHGNNVTSLRSGNAYSIVKNRVHILAAVLCRIPNLLRHRGGRQ